ncbi:hypothetical protein [Caballeronia ptereochthonis]|uniref:Uncharacterized protein n=1 Tax=Caballeronia ptereochthonis TaxID=1777144 RepID=A0A158DYU1_9BURK|nr:hypothetical protein [Caballeronia ptereochthonis]SAK99748.1 hypothetical protein AWB83_06138 [Caballeronia ptereochthonis]
MDAQASTQGNATTAPVTAAGAEAAATTVVGDMAAETGPAGNGRTSPAPQQPQDGAAKPQQAAAPQTLEEQLQVRQLELQQIQSRLTTLQSDIKELQSGINDVAQAKKSYDASLPNADQNQKALSAASQVTLESAKAKLDAATIETIDAAITAYDGATKQLTENEKNARTTVQTTAKAAWDAAQAVPPAQDDVDAQKDLPKKLAAMLKDVTGLIEQGKNAFTQGDFAASYFYAKEAVTLVTTTAIPKPDEYETELRRLSGELETSKHDATDSKVAADGAQAALKQASAALAAQTSARRAAILAQIKKA